MDILEHFWPLEMLSNLQSKTSEEIYNRDIYCILFIFAKLIFLKIIYSYVYDSMYLFILYKDK